MFRDGPVDVLAASFRFDLTTLALVEDDYGFTLARPQRGAGYGDVPARRPAASYSSAAINWSSPARPDRLANCKAGILQNLTADLCVEGWPNGSPRVRAISPACSIRVTSVYLRLLCHRSAPGRHDKPGADLVSA